MELRRLYSPAAIAGDPADRLRALPHYVAAFVLAAVVYVVWAFAHRPHALERVMDIPCNVLLFSFITVCVGLACAGQRYVHHCFRAHEFVKHNEVGGFIIAVVGSLYGVVVGFLTVVAWQHYADARQLVALEAAAAVDGWHVALRLPAERRTRVRADLLQYANLMIEQEWPDMHGGRSDVASGWVAMDAMAAAEDFTPRDAGESNAQTTTLGQLEALHDLRQRRLSDNTDGILSFEWTVLLVGASCVVCFCWLFGMPHRRVHYVMTSAVTVIVVSTLTLLFELQFPFRSGIGITSADWSAVIEHIHSMQAGPMANMRM